MHAHKPRRRDFAISISNMRNHSVRTQQRVLCHKHAKWVLPSDVGDSDADAAESGDGAEAVDAAGVEALSCRLSLGSAAAAPESSGESDLTSDFIIRSVYINIYIFPMFIFRDIRFFTHRCVWYFMHFMQASSYTDISQQLRKIGCPNSSVRTLSHPSLKYFKKDRPKHTHEVRENVSHFWNMLRM